MGRRDDRVISTSCPRLCCEPLTHAEPLDGLTASATLKELIRLPPALSPDPLLLIFIAGVLVGAALVLLVFLIPDVILALRHIAARRRAGGGTGDHIFPH